MLAQAESGKLRALAVATVSDEGIISTWWAGEASSAELFAAASGMASDLLDEVRCLGVTPSVELNPIAPIYVGDN